MNFELTEEHIYIRDTAKDFMGHSKDMSYFYEHLDSKKIKEMLKDQIYKLEDLPPEKKAELEKQIEEQSKIVMSLQDAQKEMQNELEETKKDLKKEAKENRVADEFVANIFRNRPEILRAIEKGIEKEKLKKQNKKS